MRIPTSFWMVLAMSGSTMLAVACGGAQPPVEGPPAPPVSTEVDASAPTPPPAPVAEAPDAAVAPAPAPAPAPVASAPAWKDMSKEQRLEFMKNTVMPKMKEEFVALDAKRYANMNCATCHGDGAKDKSFKMPNPKLPKLSPAGGFKKHMDKHPEITKFMMQKVVPDMAALLGEEPYDPKTQKGFGCVECHLLQK